MKTNTLKSFLTITLAMFIISVAIYFFLIPSEVITGSVTGLAMVLAKITSLSISTLTFVINVLLLILGIVLIGKEFGAKTIYASLLGENTNRLKAMTRAATRIPQLVALRMPMPIPPLKRRRPMTTATPKTAERKAPFVEAFLVKRPKRNGAARDTVMRE